MWSKPGGTRRVNRAADRDCWARISSSSFGHLFCGRPFYVRPSSHLFCRPSWPKISSFSSHDRCPTSYRRRWSCLRWPKRGVRLLSCSCLAFHNLLRCAPLSFFVCWFSFFHTFLDCPPFSFFFCCFLFFGSPDP